MLPIEPCYTSHATNRAMHPCTHAPMHPYTHTPLARPLGTPGYTPGHASVRHTQHPEGVTLCNIVVLGPLPAQLGLRNPTRDLRKRVFTFPEIFTFSQNSRSLRFLVFSKNFSCFPCFLCYRACQTRALQALT